MDHQYLTYCWYVLLLQLLRATIGTVLMAMYAKNGLVEDTSCRSTTFFVSIHKNELIQIHKHHDNCQFIPVLGPTRSPLVVVCKISASR